MKSASPELIALLNSGVEFLLADCYRIETMSGVSYYTGADVPVDIGAQRYNADGPLISRNATKSSVGLEVDSLNLKFAPRAGVGGDTIEGLPFAQAVRAGALDGAQIELRRAFLSAWGAPAVGALLLFSGRVSDSNPSRTMTDVIVKSDVELLNVRVPRNMAQPPCVKTPYSPACGLQRGTLTQYGVVSGGAQTTTAVATTLTAPVPGYFDKGVFAFTSGPNTGLRRTIKSYTGGVFTFALPLPVPPGAGDNFLTYPVCGKRKDRCVEFGNDDNFRGFRFVPKPEVAA